MPWTFSPKPLSSTTPAENTAYTQTGLLQNARPLPASSGRALALAAAASCNNGKNVRRIRTICEFAEHFYVYLAAPPGGAEPPPLQTQVNIYALILILQQTLSARFPACCLLKKVHRRGGPWPSRQQQAAIAAKMFGVFVQAANSPNNFMYILLRRRAGQSRRPYKRRHTFTRSSLFCSRPFPRASRLAVY